MSDEQDSPGIRVPPPLFFLLPLALGLLLDRRFHIPFLPRRVARILGWPLVGGGLALSGWSVRTMLAAETTMRTDKAVSQVLQEGPFRYTRNPLYLSDAMIYAGISVIRNSLWTIVLLPLGMFVIEREVMGREESYLERTFGEEYLAYKARVRRWI
jgi:protein-S-isoprenylcysteine O-methyltransferase Ste14